MYRCTAAIGCIDVRRAGLETSSLPIFRGGAMSGSSRIPIILISSSLALTLYHSLDATLREGLARLTLREAAREAAEGCNFAWLPARGLCAWAFKLEPFY